MTISKTQGANIKKLIVWFDCPTVPKWMGYVALSRVRKSHNIKILSPMVTDQLTPALSAEHCLPLAICRLESILHTHHRTIVVAIRHSPRRVLRVSITYRILATRLNTSRHLLVCS